ncbi:hypothetical protein AB4212_21710 [Streptomyces sp. 2MCAF27]
MDGRLHSITDEERGDRRALLATLTDSTGSLSLEFHDAHPDLEAGQLLRLTGQAHTRAPRRSIGHQRSRLPHHQNRRRRIRHLRR